jgi:hypothetical protein
MKILFWTGYQKTPWDGNTTSGIAGSEIAVMKIAEELVTFGYEVVVSGDVIHAGKIRGVEYCSLHNIHADHFNTFDIIVGTSYAHCSIEFEQYHKAKKIFWAHNTTAHNWHKGKDLGDDKVQKLLSREEGYYDATVTLTFWHSRKWEDNYNWLKENQAKIGNGIDKTTFVGHPNKKINSFIWSSAIDRGLIELLLNWHKIKEVLPDAVLNVYWPEYSSKFSQIDHINKNKSKYEKMGVMFHGPVDQVVLHRAMLESDFWCYLTSYEETYCITALEMQYAKVLPIVTKVAALKETVHSGIILEDDETKWDILVKTLRELSPSLKKFATDKAHDWAKRQTWNERAYVWKDLFELILTEETETTQNN